MGNRHSVKTLTDTPTADPIEVLRALNDFGLYNVPPHILNKSKHNLTIDVGCKSQEENTRDSIISVSVSQCSELQ